LNVDEYDAIGQRIVEMRAHMDAAVMSQASKRSLRSELESMQKKNKALRAAAKQVRTSGIISRAVEDVREWRERTGERGFVQVLELGSDSAAVKSAIEQLRKIHPDLSYLGVSTEASSVHSQLQDLQQEKITIFAFVSESAQQKGLSASAWVSKVAQSCGGRGGGNSGLAHGSAMLSAADQKDVASRVAREYLVDILQIL